MTSTSSRVVAIAISTYKRSRTCVPCALESALSQTDPKLKVIVSNNCSTDGTDVYVHAQHLTRHFSVETTIGRLPSTLDAASSVVADEAVAHRDRH
jgi:GT2 family glycosyltransferase